MLNSVRWRSLHSHRRLVGCGLLSLLPLCFAACAQRHAMFPGGARLKHSYIQIEPRGEALSSMAAAAQAYRTAPLEADDAALDDLSLKHCLELALAHNRGLRRATHAAERIGLGRRLARRDLAAPFLDASYDVVDGDDSSRGGASMVGRWAGFEFEPFISYDFDESADDPMSGNYGLAVSRQLLRLDTEQIRQYLPLTRATRDFHIALNDRALEVRRLRLAVIQAFYDIQRLSMRVAVRVKRQTDAEQFLATVSVKVANGLAARVQETNAKISLNQAQADLVREQTNLQDAKESLLDLMGLALTRSLSINAEDLTSIRHTQIDLLADAKLIRARHERVRNLLLAMETQRLEYRVDLDELRPDASATVTASSDTDGFDDDGQVSATFRLRVPLDAYRAERARATQDRLRLMELTLQLASLRSELEMDLRSRERSIKQLQITARLAAERLESELRKLEATIKRYDTGELDNLEVVRAKETVDNAELALLEARISRILEEARYRARLPALELRSKIQDTADDAVDANVEPKSPSP
jgi:outer membrane protein TolC